MTSTKLCGPGYADGLKSVNTYLHIYLK